MTAAAPSTPHRRSTELDATPVSTSASLQSPGLKAWLDQRVHTPAKTTAQADYEPLVYWLFEALLEVIMRRPRQPEYQVIVGNPNFVQLEEAHMYPWGLNYNTTADPSGSWSDYLQHQRYALNDPGDAATPSTLYSFDAFTGWVNVPSQYPHQPPSGFSVIGSQVGDAVTVNTPTWTTDLVPAISLPTVEAADADEDDKGAFAAFADLRRWLMLSGDEVSTIVGVGRTTPYTWKREESSPRTKTERRLYQLHATVAALVQRLGEDGAKRFLVSGDPSPTSLLLDGQHDRALRAIETAVFEGPRRIRVNAWVPELAADPTDVPAIPTPRPRRRRRGRATAGD